MKFARSILLVALFAFIVFVKFSTIPSSPPVPAELTTSAGSAVNPAVPVKAIQVLQIVRSTGQPPDGYVGGRTFENREGRLPSGGDYREFDVDPHHGQRNADRIIVEWNSKKAWYTGDHYQTFIPLP